MTNIISAPWKRMCEHTSSEIVALGMHILNWYNPFWYVTKHSQIRCLLQIRLSQPSSHWTTSCIWQWKKIILQIFPLGKGLQSAECIKQNAVFFFCHISVHKHFFFFLCYLKLDLWTENCLTFWKHAERGLHSNHCWWCTVVYTEIFFHGCLFFQVFIGGIQTIHCDELYLSPAESERSCHVLHCLSLCTFYSWLRSIHHFNTFCF